jgi:UDP-GlcNAc:undecaprenyl-phosphate/decaprenyl-phosphate GlcNAc-1-phosphate transferase
MHFSSLEPLPFAISLVMGSSCCIAILASRRYHIHRSARGHDRGDGHAIHRRPVPRIGGAAVICGYSTGLAWLSDEVGHLGLVLLLSATLLVLTGLREDLSYGSRPRTRLVAAILSSCGMALWTGYLIGSSPIPYLDFMLAVPSVAFVFTVLAGATMAHSVNLIDGLNGLAGGYLLANLTGLAAVSLVVGDPVIATLALLFVASLISFLAFNFPYGAIFLGDAGAYVGGHMLAWLSIIFLARNPEVSAYAILLMALWPLSDSFTAIFRRIKARRSPGEADRLHFHHIVYRLLRIRMRNEPSWQVNSLASALIAPLYVAPVLAGVIFHESSLFSILAMLFFLVTFVLLRTSLRYKFRISTSRSRI